jgi:hypothetical protein
MRIAVIFNQDRPDTWGVYFLRAFRDLGHEVRHWRFDDIASCREPYDVYVRIDDGDRYDEGLPPQCRPSVFWVSDSHLEGPMKKLYQGARRYDVVGCAMRRGVERLQAAGISAEWLQGGACDPEVHQRLPLPRTLDVGFVGTDGGTPRKFYLQALRERYPNSYLRGAAHERMAQIYSRSKIGFNYCPSQDTLTMRCFEIMACGALLLLNEVAGHTHRLMGFEPGTHFVLYRSPRELFELIDYYLARDVDRQRIAEAGYRETLAHHTYAHRVQRLGAILARRFGGIFQDAFSQEPGCTSLRLRT